MPVASTAIARRISNTDVRIGALSLLVHRVMTRNFSVIFGHSYVPLLQRCETGGTPAMAPFSLTYLGDESSVRT